MENIKTDIKGNVLHIEIDLTHKGGISTSGKSIRIASTEGNVVIKDDISIGINCYRPVK